LDFQLINSSSCQILQYIINFQLSQEVAPNRLSIKCYKSCHWSWLFAV